MGSKPLWIRALTWALIGFVIVLIDYMMWSASRRTPLTREQAAKESYSHLEAYSRRHNLQVQRFGKPKVIRGKVAHYDEKQRQVYGPTWEFYYTYKGEPDARVLIIYDEMNRVTELADVYEPGEKWPME